MSKPKIAVIWFPGMNCEQESKRACVAAGMDADIVRWNNAKLERYDGYLLPGGWSFEDRIRAGVIASKDSLFDALKTEAKSGKPVLGICNGCQVLAETGLVPGIKPETQLALAPNINPFVSGYYCTWVKVKHVGKRNAYNAFFKAGEILDLPIAHGEGRFISAEKGLIEQLEKNGQIVFKYCNANGSVVHDFPVNPNGAVANIAAVSNVKGNVLAIMPHPERAFFKHQLKEKHMANYGDAMTLAPAAKLFESMRESLKR
ncbi:MAG: phosphoribosylformylglycinamidine synthase I [Nanoarchaeota archaeon]|nr:phosphoribosylformylglycinamidine synthase I [Nanoarchaeota archaeon]